MEALEVIQVGAFGSIQDAGRVGFRSYAIPQSGCLDAHSHWLSNFLAGNEREAPVLELIGGKFTFKCLAELSLGLVGIGQTVSLNGKEIDSAQTIFLKESDELTVVTLLSYLSISGSLASVQHFESYSSYPLAGLGASPLRKGIILDVDINKVAQRSFKKELSATVSDTTIIRIMQGPEWNDKMEKSEFEKVEWKASKNSNRIGIRLNGTPITMKFPEMSSVPTFAGTIQLPPDGQPIVLLNDAQTTGGYPRIGQVIKADLSRMARVMLGGTIRFKFVTIQEARYIFHRQQSFIQHELNSFI